MLIKILLGSLALSLLTSSLMGSPKKLSETFEYDADNGWWWYKESYEDKDKKFEVKTKFTNKEKMEKDSSDEKLRIMREQNYKLTKIKERLEYAYPNITPIYTTDERTGKKCKTNSSEFCFVFPLQAEAQHVPVMADWLSNPNPENSKKWLRWQAKYFNHITNIGYGNKFAYISGGSEAYPTDNYRNDGDHLNFSKTRKWQRVRELNIIQQLKDKITFLIFLGKTSSLDATIGAEKQFYRWLKHSTDISYYFVFESQELMDDMEKRIMELSPRSNKDAFKKIKKSGAIVVKPSYFKKFNIKISPTVVVTYKKDRVKGKKSEIIWQKTLTGGIQPYRVIKSANQFLIYNKIIEPKELGNDITIRNVQTNIKFNEIEHNEDKIFESTNVIKIKR